MDRPDSERASGFTLSADGQGPRCASSQPSLSGVPALGAAYRIPVAPRGREHFTLENDPFPASEFDLMLSNPPYGKI